MVDPLERAILSHWGGKHLIWCNPYKERFSVTGKKASNMV